MTKEITGACTFYIVHNCRLSQKILLLRYADGINQKIKEFLIF